MDKQKQLNEMHQILLSAGYDWWKTAPNGKTKSEYEAECFYNAGYRKIHEDAVVLTREEFERHKGFSREEVDEISETAIKNSSKETAEKFAERVSQAIVDNTYPYFDKDGKPVNIWKAVLGFDKIDEICKEFTGEEK